MRILSTVTKSYASRRSAIEPMYLWFSDPLRKLGHEVEHFDHVQLASEIGPDACGAAFENRVKHGRYDLVLYQTAGRDVIDRESIARAGRHAPIVAWNSDDDWQWESYTSQIAPLFSNMVTTYHHVYEANRAAHPNLVLSQWGCLDTYADFARKKDLDFTFAGQIYSSRVADCLQLKRWAGLNVFGLGSIRIRYPFLAPRPVYKFVAERFPFVNKPLEFKQVHDIWNRSKVSYVPLGASTNPALLQVKGRVFEMGASGTMMLTQRSSDLERFYEPGKEYIDFGSIDECADKAKFYLRNHAERTRIAEAYRRRTESEHMWEHRFTQLFHDIGAGTRPMRIAA